MLSSEVKVLFLSLTAHLITEFLKKFRLDIQSYPSAPEKYVKNDSQTPKFL